MKATSDRQSEHCKIAVVVPKYGLVGGGERFTSEVTKRLADNPHFDIHVFANRWISNSERITFHKVPLVRFPRFLRPLSFAWLAERMINRGNFDLVHSHDRIFRADVFSLHCVPHAGWVKDVRKKRPSLFDRAMISIEQRMMKGNRASWFLPVSSIAMEAFKNEYGSLPGQWEIMHPGVDAARFSMPDRDNCRKEIRQLYGIGASDFLILFVGMNFEVKGLDTIITAVAQARKARPETAIHLLVVGRGDEKKYGEIAHSLGIADAVTFAGTQAEGIERYYRAADCFAMLSTFDTFGMVVLEALAAGLPVIVSPNVGAKDIVVEGINGFVLPNGQDSDAAAARIGTLCDNGVRDIMEKAAIETASKHDWNRLAAEICRIFEMKYQTKVVC